MKRMRRVLLTFIMCFMTVFAFAVTSEAAAKPTCAKSKTVYMGKGWDTNCVSVGGTSANIVIKNLSKTAKITNIRCSNPKIVAVRFNRSQYSKGLIVSAAQWQACEDNRSGWSKWRVVEGTTKISFTVKQNGKSYRLSCKYTVKTVPSPLKSLKVNGKQYAAKLKGSNRVKIKVGKSTAKISFSGNNLKSLKAYYYDKNMKKVTVKNNSTVKVPKNEWLNVMFDIKFKKGKFGLPYYHIMLTR